MGFSRSKLPNIIDMRIHTWMMPEDMFEHDLSIAGDYHYGTMQSSYIFVTDPYGAYVSGSLQGILEELAWEKGGRVDIDTSDVSNPPTDAQLDAIFGSPAQVGNGFMRIIDDAGAGSNEYIIWSDGSNWFYATGTKAT
jgi:hypothetical protein